MVGRGKMLYWTVGMQSEGVGRSAGRKLTVRLTFVQLMVDRV